MITSPTFARVPAVVAVPQIRILLAVIAVARVPVWNWKPFVLSCASPVEDRIVLVIAGIFTHREFAPLKLVAHHQSLNVSYVGVVTHSRALATHV